MSARSFRSVFMVASCAGAALGCYLVSLHVASERAAVDDAEAKIVMAQRDIRLLQTEIGTRGRLAQLERWNVRVLALSAPSADQFLEGGFALARLARPEPKPQIQAPVVLASAPLESTPALASEAASQPRSATADALLHEASLKRPMVESVPLPNAAKREIENAPAATVAARPADKKSGDNKAKAEAKPVTRVVRTAKVDPLAPLPAGASSSKRKETGPTR